MKVLKKPGMEGHTVKSEIMGMPYGIYSTTSINIIADTIRVVPVIQTTASINTF
jgi:hypothetical protein